MAQTTELLQLKKLKADILAFDETKTKLEKVKNDKGNLESSCYQVKVTGLKSTNNADNYDKAVRASWGTTKNIINVSVAVVTIIAMIAFFIAFLNKANFVGDDYLYTPEIEKTYTRIYDAGLREATYEVFTITSCSKSGKVKATLNRFEENKVKNFEMSGDIISKSQDGKCVRLRFDYEYDNYLSDKNLIICDDFNTVKTDKFCLRASEPLNTSVLESPEIGGSYIGMRVGYENTVTITSCDENGNISGFYEINSSTSAYGKSVLSGKVTERHEDGRISCTLTVGDWIKKSYVSKPTEMTVDFLPRDRIMLWGGYVWINSSVETIDELYENYIVPEDDYNTILENNEFLKRTPLTEKEKSERSVILWLLFLSPVLGIIASIVLKKVLCVNSFSPAQTAKLSELRELDRQNKIDNDNAHNQAIEDKKQASSGRIKAYDEEIAELKKRLAELEKEVAENDVLGENDKDIDTLNYLIVLIEGKRADSVKEALLRKDEEDRRNAEIKRQKEEERRRQEEELRRQEQERRSKMPGMVIVGATEDGKGKNAEVYVDGNYYGAISYVTGTTCFQLNPGIHNVSVIIQSQGYRFQSGVQSFEVRGGESVTLNFKVLGYNSIICIKS